MKNFINNLCFVGGVAFGVVLGGVSLCWLIMVLIDIFSSITNFIF